MRQPNVVNNRLTTLHQCMIAIKEIDEKKSTSALVTIG